MQLPWRSLPQPPFARTTPPVQRPVGTVALLALVGAGWVVQWAVAWTGHGRIERVVNDGALTAAGLQTGRWWQVGTHLFVYAGAAWLLAASVLALALAGAPLERIAGRRHLWRVFLLAGVLGGLGQVGFDALLGRDARWPVAGPSSAAMGVLLALACVAPRTPLVPWRGAGGVFRRVQAVHGAVGALAATLAAGTTPPAAGALVGGLTGCLCVHALARRGRGDEEHEETGGGDGAAKVSAASSASWPPGGEAPAPRAQPDPVSGEGPAVLTAPAAAARNALVVPRLTERERRMTTRGFIAEKIDPILDKISREGMASLTAGERLLLEKARAKMGQK